MTNNFTIVGRLLTTAITIKDENFGVKDLPLAKMRNLRAMGGASLDMDVGVDASKYANQGQWMDTAYTR